MLTTRLSCHLGAPEAEAKLPLYVSNVFISQVSLGDSCLEADHVISALPASGNGVAALPFPNQGEASYRFLGQEDHTMPLDCSFDGRLIPRRVDEVVVGLPPKKASACSLQCSASCSLLRLHLWLVS